MFISYWIAAFFPILILPRISNELYQSVFQIERSQIALDNAAVLLGNADVDWLNWLSKENDALERWETLHHVAHLCRLNAITGVTCVSADTAWETAILARHWRAGVTIQTKWRLAQGKARAELARLGSGHARLQRVPLAPIRPKRCGICGLSVGWKVERLPESKLEIDSLRKLTSSVNVRKGIGGYTYEMQ